MNAFADHFSRDAAAYSTYRPTYPGELFAWLAEIAPDTARAWDCATGSGQAAIGLATHFDLVIASDASAAQLAHATPHEHVRYVAMSAERVAMREGAVSLACVAQALHWFDRPRFYSEAIRVLRPGGVLAVWRYGLTTVDPAIDAVVQRFYRDTVGPFWPPERAIVDAGYATLEFPLPELTPPSFAMEANWTLAQMAGYLGTWSAVTRFRQARGIDPIPALADDLRPLWGDEGQAIRPVRWPLEVRAGRR